MLRLPLDVLSEGNRWQLTSCNYDDCQCCVNVSMINVIVSCWQALFQGPGIIMLHRLSCLNQIQRLHEDSSISCKKKQFCFGRKAR